MSWLNPLPALAANERILWESTGSMSLRTAVAGAVYVTTARLVFIPNRLSILGPRKYRPIREWPLVQIIAVDIQDRDYTAYTGGMRKRLRLALSNGEELFFVVKGLDDAVDMMRQIIATNK